MDQKTKNVEELAQFVKQVKDTIAKDSNHKEIAAAFINTSHHISSLLRSKEGKERQSLHSMESKFINDDEEDVKGAILELETKML